MVVAASKHSDPAEMEGDMGKSETEEEDEVKATSEG